MIKKNPENAVRLEVGKKYKQTDPSIPEDVIAITSYSNNNLIAYVTLQTKNESLLKYMKSMIQHFSKFSSFHLTLEYLDVYEAKQEFDNDLSSLINEDK
jgi:hypothetical protein